MACVTKAQTIKRLLKINWILEDYASMIIQTELLKQMPRTHKNHDSLKTTVT